MDDIDQSENPIVSGCYLCTTSLYMKTPECIGCASKQKCLCINEQFCCKSGAENFGVGLASDSSESDICLLNLFCCNVGLTKNIADPICRQDSQQCCCVGQAALPPDDNIPKLIAALFLVCWSEKGEKGCFKTWGTFK